jgi:membrane protease YdiL (CAAX protease family)
VLLRNLPQGSNPVGELAISAAGPWQWVGLLLAGSVVAPLAEETFFRGVLFMGLWRRLNSFWLAAVISSAAFALVHPQLFAGFGAVMGMGIVSCLLLRERRSLVPSIVMHATYNGALLVGAMLGF